MKKAIEYLNKNKLKNIVILEVLRRGSGEILFEQENGILVFDKGLSAYMMSSDNVDIAKRIVEYIPKAAALFLVHESFYLDLIKEKFNISEVTECNNVVYTSKEKLKISGERKIQVLTEEYIDDVEKSYSSPELVGSGYLEGRIKNKELMGTFVHGELAGFVGFHEEGSIGMLEVKEKFRRKGIGQFLEESAINYALEIGKYPYGQVVVRNEKSLNLQKKLGLEISNETVYWLSV